MKKKIIIGLTIILLIGVTLFLISQNRKIEPIIIGGIMPLTGSSSSFGLTIKEVSDLRIKQWNNAGGINGHPVEILWKDGACDNETSYQAAKELIKQKNVPIIFGGFCSDETIGASRASIEANVILLSPTASSSEIPSLGNLVFRTAVSNEKQAKVLAIHTLVKHYQKVGIIIEETAYTNNLLKEFKDKYEGEIEIYSFKTLDKEALSLEIKKMKEINVDSLIIMIQSDNIGLDIVSTMNNLNWDKGVLFDEISIKNKEMQDNFSEYLFRIEAAGAELVMPLDNPKFAEFKNLYFRNYGWHLENPNFAASTLDGIDVLMNTLEIIENTHNTKQIRDALLSSQHAGFSGKIIFDNGGNIEADYSILKFNGVEFIK